MTYDRAVSHMNDDHAEALVLIAQAYGSVRDATAARIVAMDDAGMDLEVEVEDGAARQTRVPFTPPITEQAARDRLVRLAEQARHALGKAV